jgi:hypothetical protein
VTQFFENLSKLQKEAIDWHVNAVFSGAAPYDRIGDKPLNLQQRKNFGILIIHPELYRNDMREFFACDPTDVAALESLHRAFVTKDRHRSDTSPRSRDR